MTNSSSVLLGGVPTNYDKTNPIVIFIVQAAIVIIFCRLLHFPLAYMRQPRVIAEVIGGILLGPTAFGRIPGFTTTIFPSAAMPNFNLVANIGLILFLFIVGLEVDLRIVRKNARVAISVGAASLALPFGVGCFIAWLLFREYQDTLSKATFGVFLLFIGTAFSITAFPVLARILTELKLLRTDVGITVLSAGVGNDVVGWILLALTIALVNASSGLTAFYVILLVVAWTLILFYLVKPAYRWCIRKSSMSSSPSNSMMTLTLLLVLISSFYTEIIGVHPIFGAFLIGMIVPHDDGYAVSMTDKIEDLVSVLFLPLYFASSGLKTNIGLLNDGKAWGYTILIIIAATVSKFSGSMLAARYNGFLWRESSTVGMLMSCKGLVELIVLNVGLSAGILSQKLFTMFVIMALVTTFMTTPITVWLYPEWYQTKVTKWRSGEADWDGNPLEMEQDDESTKQGQGLTRLAAVIYRVEGIAPLLSFSHFLATPGTRMHLVRTVELTDRLSQIIMVSEAANLIESDSMISIVRAYAQLIGMRLSYALQTLDPYNFPSYIAQEYEQQRADLIIVPWVQDPFGGIAGNEYISNMVDARSTNLCILFESTSGDNIVRKLKGRSISMSTFAQTAIQHDRLPSARTTATARTAAAEKMHIFFPLFILGPDESLVLNLLDQFALHDRVTISIIYYKPLTSQSTSTIDKTAAKTHDRSLSDDNPELARLHNRYTTTNNVTFDIIESDSAVSDALSRLALEATKGPLTTILAHSENASLRAQVNHIDRIELSIGPSIGTTNKSDVVEVFSAYRAREGRLCIISASHTQP